MRFRKELDTEANAVTRSYQKQNRTTHETTVKGSRACRTESPRITRSPMVSAPPPHAPGSTHRRRHRCRTTQSDSVATATATLHRCSPRHRRRRRRHLHPRCPPAPPSRLLPIHDLSKARIEQVSSAQPPRALSSFVWIHKVRIASGMGSGHATGENDKE